MGVFLAGLGLFLGLLRAVVLESLFGLSSGFSIDRFINRLIVVGYWVKAVLIKELGFCPCFCNSAITSVSVVYSLTVNLALPSSNFKFGFTFQNNDSYLSRRGGTG